MLVKLFLYYIKSESNLGHFIGNIDLLLLFIAIVSATAVYFITDVKKFECLERDDSYDKTRLFCHVCCRHLPCVCCCCHTVHIRHLSCLFHLTSVVSCLLWIQGTFGVLILFYGLVRCGFTRMLMNFYTYCRKVARLCFPESKADIEERLSKKHRNGSVLDKAAMKFYDRWALMLFQFDCPSHLAILYAYFPFQI